MNFFIASDVVRLLAVSRNVFLIHEPVLLGTATTIKHLYKNEILTDLLVMHGDNYFEDNLVNLKKSSIVLSYL